MVSNCPICEQPFSWPPSQRRTYCSLLCATKGKPHKTGAAHPDWKGDEVGYKVLHKWVSRRLGKPSECENCGATDLAIRYEWANVSGEYKRETDDWLRMCVACHRNFDDVGKGQRGKEKHPRTIAKIIQNSYQRNQTHCKNGHEFTPENTYLVEPSKLYPRGRRQCLLCKAERAKRSYLKRKEATNAHR